jgi:hypothetical protein
MISSAVRGDGPLRPRLGAGGNEFARRRSRELKLATQNNDETCECQCSRCATNDHMDCERKRFDWCGNQHFSAPLIAWYQN